MSYLDDEDHDWSLEPSIPVEETLNGMVKELWARNVDEADLEIIFQGYSGLKQRHPDASDVACFYTSMVWFFG